MKRICKSLALLLLVARLLPGPAQAAGTAAVAACFRQDDQFYAFAALDKWPSTLTAELRSEERSLPVNLGPVSLAGSGLPVSYLLLVDSSAAMKDLRRSAGSFARALVQEDRTQAQFTLFSFDEVFCLSWQGEAERLAWAVSGLECAQAEQADLALGVQGALDYLAAFPRRAGELVNLVIVTAAAPEWGNAALAETAQRLAEDPSILVHTVSLSPTGVDTADGFPSPGRGLHADAGPENVKVVGAQLAQSVNSLCAMRFTWSGQDGGAELCLSWEDTGKQNLDVDMQHAPLLSVAQGGSASGGLTDPTPTPTPGGSGAAEAPPAPEGSDAPATPEASPAPAAFSGQSQWAALGAGGMALLVLAALLFLRRRRGRRPGGTASAGSVFMRLEVISGAYAGVKEFYLADELIIGRGNQCDLSWKDKDVSPRNSRIFRRDNMVYIEDLGSRHGTALGGMRLHRPNRLRSGDEITIGTVQFRLKF